MIAELSVEERQDRRSRQSSALARQGNGVASGPNIGAAERLVSALGGSWLAMSAMRRLLRRKTKSGLLLGSAGGLLLYRGMSGRSRLYQAVGAGGRPGILSHPFSREVVVRHAITIRKPIAEVYRFFRNAEKLAGAMSSASQVERMDDRRSRWCTCGPDGRVSYCEVTLTEEQANHHLAWTAGDDDGAFYLGRAEFEVAAGERGCVVRAALRYRPKGGVFGAMIAKLTNRDFGQFIIEDLRRIKQFLEVGEMATAEGPAGRRGRAATRPQPHAQVRNGPEVEEDAVVQASKDSFPASDPPSWSTTRI